MPSTISTMTAGQDAAVPIMTATDIVLPTALRPAVIWKRTLEILRRRLEADGFSLERAEEMGESAIIACALRYEPRSVAEALCLALHTVRGA